MLADLASMAPLDRRRHVLAHAITPALCELPPMPSEAAARQEMLTISGVESGCYARRQVPVAHAMGLWQLERGGGVAGVLAHRATAAHAAAACRRRQIPAAPDEAWRALERDDVLAAIFARLLLLTDPQALPSGSDAGRAVYLRTWRPGKPCSAAKWGESWRMAAAAIAE